MIVSFQAFVPPPRFDGIPWTRINIEESASPDGGWVLIDNQALNPLDADPANPEPRDFTTSFGTIDRGWYRISFLDAAGDSVRVEPIHNIPSMYPTIAQVGALLRTRTKDRAGNETGTFNANTRPTEDDVDELIKTAVSTVVTRTGDSSTIPEDLLPEVQRLVALRTAMLIEIGFFPESVASGQSPYAQYHDMWIEAFGDNKRMGTLIQAIENFNNDLSVDAAGDSQYAFPRSARIGSRRL